MKAKLRKYQSNAVTHIVNFFLKKGKGFYLADQTGLGKGVQALAIAEKLSENATTQNILIVCPAFLKPNWQAEIKKYLPSPQERAYKFFILSYTDVSNLSILRQLLKQRFLLMILDEAHYAKDFKSKRTLAVFDHRGLVTISKHLLCLSATPFPNRVGEIYPFLVAIGHKLIQNQTQEDFIKRFAAKYREFKLNRFAKKKTILNHSGVSNAIYDLTHGLGDVMLRRKKIDVLKDLPPTQRISINLEMSEKYVKQENELLRELLIAVGRAERDASRILSNFDEFSFLVNEVPGFTQLVEYKKQIGLLKIPFIFEHLKENVLPEQKKFIVFCYYTDVVEKYRELFEKEKVENVFVVTGKMNAQKRFELIDKANSLDNCVFLCTMKAVEMGLNFTGFDTSFLLK